MEETQTGYCAYTVYVVWCVAGGGEAGRRRPGTETVWEGGAYDVACYDVVTCVHVYVYVYSRSGSLARAN